MIRTLYIFHSSDCIPSQSPARIWSLSSRPRQGTPSLSLHALHPDSYPIPPGPLARRHISCITWKRRSRVKKSPQIWWKLQQSKLPSRLISSTNLPNDFFFLSFNLRLINQSPRFPTDFGMIKKLNEEISLIDSLGCAAQLILFKYLHPFINTGYPLHKKGTQNMVHKSTDITFTVVYNDMLKAILNG